MVENYCKKVVNNFVTIKQKNLCMSIVSVSSHVSSKIGLHISKYLLKQITCFKWKQKVKK